MRADPLVRGRSKGKGFCLAIPVAWKRRIRAAVNLSVFQLMQPVCNRAVTGQDRPAAPVRTCSHLFAPELYFLADTTVALTVPPAIAFHADS